MFKLDGILVSGRRRGIALAVGAVVLAGCGQKGTLYLPTEPAAAGRATLPQTLRPGTAPVPGAPASAPQR